jgi:hypothetical protein
MARNRNRTSSHALRNQRAAVGNSITATTADCADRAVTLRPDYRRWRVLRRSIRIGGRG